MKKSIVLFLTIICIIPINIESKIKIKTPKTVTSVTKAVEHPEQTITHPDETVQAIDSAAKKDFQDEKKSTENDINNALNDIFDLKKYIREQYPVKHQWTDDELQVRHSQQLCPAELNFIKNRTPIIKQSLKNNFDIDTPLNIGFCLSGGGNRAMLTSLGFLLEAQSIGLYDAALYTAALSGSTWTVCPFAYLNATQNMSLSSFKDQLTKRLSNVMKIVVSTSPAVEFPEFNDYQNQSMQDNMIKRYAYDQYLSSIDIYTSFIGNYTLDPAGKNRLDVTWSSIAKKIQDGTIPLPMGSAVAYKSSSKGSTEYYWFEVGPFEVGSDQLQAFVPTQAFGSKFNNGKIVSGYAGHAPEYPISFYEGVFGSAFTASINEIADRMENPSISTSEIKVTDPTTGKTIGKIPAQTVTIPIKEELDNSFVSDNIINNMRFSPATFHNYVQGMHGIPTSKDDKVKLFDGGLNFDVPLPLMMRPARNVDIIFICDSWVDLYSFQAAAKHFKRNNINFPDISTLTEIELTKPMTVLNDPRSNNYDKNIITIVYCPFTKNNDYSTSFDPVECKEKDYCQMLNFNYTQAQADEVINLTRYNLKSSLSDIKAILKALEQQKLSKK